MKAGGDSGQRVVPGGYQPGTFTFTPKLVGAIHFVDTAIGSMVSELQKKGQLASTTIIITAKHGQTAQAVNALQADKTGANTARIDYVLSGTALAKQFNSPTKDPRTPDFIVQPIPGTIYSSSQAKVAEHGGFATNDTHVALVVVNGKNIADRKTANEKRVGAEVNLPVRTYQVAPTILAELGLNPSQLDSVRIEHVQVLPGS